MAARGGPIIDVSVAGRLFPVAGDADVGRKLGGKENEVSPNGDGVTARILQTVSAWELDPIPLQIDDNRGDLEFLQDIADAGEPVDITYTEASGAVYGGLGVPIGEIKRMTKTAVASVGFGGGGKLEAQ